MTAHYVHVEVRELRGPSGGQSAEADVVVTLSDGVRTACVAQLRSVQAPFWRVVSLEAFGDPLLARAVDEIGEEALCERIATAAALWNVWDSLRANDA